MEDAKIVELFWARNEDAIKETDAVYGRRLNALARNILQSCEDAEKSVNDTYMETAGCNTIILFLHKMISSFYLSRFTADRLGGLRRIRRIKWC